MKALVTGGTGFIGSHLIEKLCSNNISVKCISKDYLNTDQLINLDVELIIGDLEKNSLSENLLDGIDLIFHVAGVTHAKSKNDYYIGNYLATKKLIEFCANSSKNIKRFIYISSLTAVGPSLTGTEVNENTPYHPVSDYGISKMMAEYEVLKYRNKIPITIVRPSAVYGPRERDFYIYMKSIKRGIQLLIGINKKYLNLIYIDDLVDGITLAAQNKQAEDEIYFLGSDTSYPNETIGKTIAEILDKNPLNIHLPHCIVFGICSTTELLGNLFNKHVLLNRQKARELTQNSWACSIEKAKKHLGFNPNTSLHEGFFQTYCWYKKMGWL
ncbi:MAG: NAD(P)-dependent oxidoreductase [Ignavibacteriota bacterium]|jgi:nucleoside-diphosphate-sugar epimerase|nr:MAG: NAD(P)-dependent oxidoreductase [Ignavibacterium sp.]MBL1153291.1 NAD(P)-dependent oxidoreductase [Ignavibacteriota bacterium]MCZ2269992.1 NAD(P)-dependent oxidoreductase [Ignavibacteriales bacterium]MDX9713506.1 NAD(P)-dependent oxidoreductase [Ignavibacteriaceae bacterium]MBW7843612.1 NAD(P)-dependent oxidoreductase [Ignavibacterium sp.]